MVRCQLYGVRSRETAGRDGDGAKRRRGEKGRISRADHLGLRIANLKTRSQETGVRIQEKKNKKEFLLPTGYWLLTTRFLPWALSPVP